MSSPTGITLRAYQVGFGDCFLLTFHYKEDVGDRHVLIDFGTTGIPDGFPEDQMLYVARDIATVCGGKLHVVVATHRHQDHISGFSTQGRRFTARTLGETAAFIGKTTGDIISDLDPDIVILPWTEDPDLKTNAKKPKGLVNEDDYKSSPQMGFAATLRDMQTASRIVVKESERLSLKKKSLRNLRGFLKPIDEDTSKQLSFLGENNLSNLSAVKNLQSMSKGGKRARYVYYKSGLNIASVLPGVEIDVLGPPTVDQHAAVAKQRSKDKDEFWMLQSIHKNYWSMQAATADLIDGLDCDDQEQSKIFPNAEVFNTSFEPSETRWFTRRIRSVRAAQLLELVRILDDALNNTSVILLFSAGTQKLLFPGDAQIENWEYALKYAPDPERSRTLKLLKGTTLYKVGHHGSRNATPKTLWRNFGKKSPSVVQEKSLQTVNSTMEGKHGKTKATAVPRETLVDAMKEESRYWTTQTIVPDINKLCVTLSIKV